MMMDNTNYCYQWSVFYPLCDNIFIILIKLIGKILLQRELIWVPDAIDFLIRVHLIVDESRSQHPLSNTIESFTLNSKCPIKYKLLVFQFVYIEWIRSMVGCLICRFAQDFQYALKAHLIHNTFKKHYWVSGNFNVVVLFVFYSSVKLSSCVQFLFSLCYRLNFHQPLVIHT